MGQSNGKAYYHVYNRGVEKRVIFADSRDYETFESYLSDYLTPPADPESVKKIFTVHGRTFKGTPHQPKNHHGKILLLGYSLMPDHFHLILQQNDHGHLESFIRSLGTRYSMYFNKKYNRKGSLFEGPYRSVHIREEYKLFPLINYIHHGDNDYSSHPEYSGKRTTPWVNTKIALSEQNGVSSQSDNDLIGGLTIEDGSQPLERSLLATNETNEKKNKKTTHRIPELFAITAVFFLLLGLGVRNINATKTKSLASVTSESSPVLSESTEATDTDEFPTPEPATKTMVVVQIDDSLGNINIRQGPSVDSEKIGVAKNGDSFELISEVPEWYEIKLADNTTGFILAELAYLDKTIN